MRISLGEEIMNPTNSYRSHLSGPKDLVTTYEARRAGFLALALEKNKQATPIVTEAKAMKVGASRAKAPEGLLEIPEIQGALLKAAGISDKAERHLSEEDKRNAKINLIEKYLKPSGPSFVDEFVYRFLLTQGDALGGTMRNIGGRWAKSSFLDMLRATLSNSGTFYEISLNGSGEWQQNDKSIPSEVLKGLRWKRMTRGNALDKTVWRSVIVDYTVRSVRKNVDFCLFSGTSDRTKDEYFQDPSNYIALGELKGGIDPAGADEHWKTGNSALNRIRKAFGKLNLHPATFFIAAAIEDEMAREIWEQLENGVLSNAANLTDDGQLGSICFWILNL